MNVFIYKASGQWGCLYDLTFNPEVDLYILRQTRGIDSIEILAEEVEFSLAYGVIEEIKNNNFLSNMIKMDMRKIKKAIGKAFSPFEFKSSKGIKFINREIIENIENFITGRIATLSEIRKVSKADDSELFDVIQYLYAERRIRIVPPCTVKKGKRICTICEKEECSECCIGFKGEDMLLYAADNYNIGSPEVIKAVPKKTSEYFQRASEELKDFVTSRKKYCTLWCAPGYFDYSIIAPAVSETVSYGGKVLFISHSKDLDKCVQELQMSIEGVSFRLYSSSEFNPVESSCYVCSGNDYPCFYKTFDLVIFDERHSFLSGKPLGIKNISRKAVKENGKHIVICSAMPESDNTKSSIFQHNQVIIIPPAKTPLPEPMIFSQKSIRSGGIIPQLAEDTMKWSIETGMNLIIFVPEQKDIGIIKEFVKEKLEAEEESIIISGEDSRWSDTIKKDSKSIIITNLLSDALVYADNINTVVYRSDHSFFASGMLIHISAIASSQSRKKTGCVIFINENSDDKSDFVKSRIRGLNKAAWEKGYLKK